ncbi:DNA polymerase III subunit delta [uncultured Sphingomonas sp.]|uniref:DNA polymerase III subunit delta n=1 Tax=uncultured Sphingomonas sp. TaxID=158754 RepID=UPI0025FD8385|nr:DNA polymerase III subunit delta [uncultured Sphingomonas sp.]
MKPASGAIGGALDRPDSSVRFYLFHGADEAGSRALAGRLLAGLAADKHRLAGGALKSDPAQLADEAGAIAMFGGKRLLWIDPAGEEITAAVQALLELPVVEHPVVAIAGTLRKTSALLKLAESDPAALAQISYLPEGRQVDRIVQELGRGEGLRIAPELATRIAAAAYNDQAVIAQEVRKFALYAGATIDSPRDLTGEMLDLLGANAADGDASRLGDLALSGDMLGLNRELERLESSGIDTVSALRAIQRRLLMLAPLRARIEAGQSVEAVGASVFWKDRPLVARALARWSSQRLAQLVGRIAGLERQLLLGSVPDRVALGHELLQIARAGR